MLSCLFRRTLSPPRRAASRPAEVAGGIAARAFNRTRPRIELSRFDMVAGSVGVGLPLLDFLRRFRLCPLAGPGFGHAFLFFLPEEKTESQPARYFGVETLEK